MSNCVTGFRIEFCHDRAPLVLVVLTCLSLCSTQARAVNLIHAVLCDDEGVTQARGC